MIEMGLAILSTLVLPVMGWYFVQLRALTMKLEHKPERHEVRQIVADLQRPTEVVQQELKEDIQHLEKKIDKLLEKSGG